MRNSELVLLSLALATIILLVPSTATAQVSGELGLKYSDHASGLGIAAGAWYPVSIIDVGGELTIYFPSDDEGGDLNSWSVDVNGRYPIPLESDIRLYAVGGINITNRSWEGNGPFGARWKESATDTGLNVGTMAEFGGEDFGFFAAIKFILGGADGLNFGGGVRKRF